MPRAAGILNLISGFMHLLGSVFVLIFGWLGDGFFSILWYGMVGTPLNPLTQPMSPDVQPILAMPVMVVSIVCIVGGIHAVRKRAWRLALAGSICGVLLTWFLGIPAIILILLSKRQFR